MKVAVAGLGLSNAVLLAQHHHMMAMDISADSVSKVNAQLCPIVDKDLEEFLSNKALNLIATTNPEESYRGAGFVIVVTPTNYDPVVNYFDKFKQDTNIIIANLMTDYLLEVSDKVFTRNILGTD